MPYSLDLRKRVVSYIRSGGSKASAHRIFKVSMWCVNDWSKREDLNPIPSKGRPRKIDWVALNADIEKYPDKLLRERAAEFGVWPNAIWYACRVLKQTHKKNVSIRGKES
jgi:transposase